MGEVTRRDLIRAGAAGAGALALAGLPTGMAAAAATRHAKQRYCRWGAFVDPKGGPAMPPVFAFERLVERKLDVTRHYVHWGAELPDPEVRRSADTGHIPIVALEAKRSDGTSARWADIAAGSYDGQLRRWGQALAAWGAKAYFVFNHEPENDVAAGNADEFRFAYDHVRDVFDASGARNLRWVCTLMRPTYEGMRGGPAAWLPDSYEMLAVDGYNRGYCDPTKGWISFETIFLAAHTYAVSAGRKLIIQEWGSVGRTACGVPNPQTKAAWLRDAAVTIKSWTEIKAVVYTQKDATFRGFDVDFRVDTTPETLRTFTDIGHDPYFNPPR